MILAGFLRSNAFLLVGFYGYWALKKSILRMEFFHWFYVLIFLIIGFFPIILLEIYARQLHCDSAEIDDFSSKTSAPLKGYCIDIFPTLYGTIQKEYWDVGFLRFYKISNIPCFLLALPMLVLSYGGIYSYFSFNWKRTLISCL